MRNVSVFLSNYLQLDCMMWGGLLATFHATGKNCAWLTNRYTQAAVYALFLLLAARGEMFLGFADGALYWDIYALLAAIILYNLVQPTSLINLEYQWLSRLGTWSYGIYMLHVLVIVPLVKLVGGNDYVLYPSVFAGTIGLAWLSYNYLEKPFFEVEEPFCGSKKPPIGK